MLASHDGGSRKREMEATSRQVCGLGGIGCYEARMTGISDRRRGRGAAVDRPEHRPDRGPFEGEVGHQIEGAGMSS